MPDVASNRALPAGSQGDWQQALEALERILLDAVGAVQTLRRSLEPVRMPRMAAVPVAEPRAALPAEPVDEPVALADGRDPSPFERLWDRLEQERLGEAQSANEPERRGLAALPSQYIFTVEDTEGRADLIALHRAFQSLRGVREISLMSFVNGVPIVSVNAERELDMGEAALTIGDATDRQCNIITQDGPKVHVRLQSREGRV